MKLLYNSDSKIDNIELASIWGFLKFCRESETLSYKDIDPSFVNIFNISLNNIQTFHRLVKYGVISEVPEELINENLDSDTNLVTLCLTNWAKKRLESNHKCLDWRNFTENMHNLRLNVTPAQQNEYVLSNKNVIHRIVDI